MNSCPEDIVQELKNTNWNLLHGTVEDIEKFKTFMKCVNPYEVDKILIDQNRAFVHAVLTSIYAKNKLDYPPFGPTNTMKQTYQSAKITEILRGLLDKQKTSDPQYKFGSLDLENMTRSGFETVGSWGLNTARGIGRTLSQPRQMIANTGKSIKNMFGMNTDPEYGTYYKGGKRSHRKTRRHPRKV
jgi:hypothetical protein